MKKQEFIKLVNKLSKNNFEKDLMDLIRTLAPYENTLGNSQAIVGNFMLTFEMVNQLQELNSLLRKVHNIEEEKETIEEIKLPANPIKETKMEYKRDEAIVRKRQEQLKPSFVGDPELPLDSEEITDELISVKNARRMKPDFKTEEIVKISEEEILPLEKEIEVIEKPKKTIKKKTPIKKSK